jgi:DNA-binding NtrC family response regulator
VSHRFRDQEDGEEATYQLPGLESELCVRRFRVEVVQGPDGGKSAVSEGDELAIGTAAGNDLVLSDGTVSRHHCAVNATARGFWLRDLDSTNGTRLVGFRVGSAKLKSGASFTVGRSTLRFDALDDDVRTALSPSEAFAGVLGKSAAMRRIFAMLPRLAATDATVLIEGETGTGKSLLASAIHDTSPRSACPFVVLDCASITPTLIESQLFGHSRGAFTGAQQAREGAFQVAGGGTLFLDEIGELPLDLQPKLLRVLEERKVTPLGTTQEVAVDVRVIAATNRDLREEVNRGRFRTDLYYRLNVVRLRVPPLRERPEDIAPLVEHFYRQCSPNDPHPPEALVATWRDLHWSGNVRELRSAVERAVLLGAMADGPKAADDRPPAAGDGPHDLALPFRAAKERVVTRFEHAYLAALIERHQGNISQAARAAHMDRNHLRELLRRHGIEPKAE